MKNLRNEYNYQDSAQMFLRAILAPQILGLIFIITAVVIASFFGVGYNEAIDVYIVKILSLFIAQLAFVIVFFTFNKKRQINYVKATNLNKKINFKQVVIILAIAFVCLFLFSPLINMVDYLISLTGYSASSELPINFASFEGAVVGIIAFAIMPAIFEELIFRGVVFNGMKGKFGVKKAIIFSALLFALMHTSIQQTTYQIIIGVVLAYVYYITGSLRASVLLHFLNNFIIIVLNIVVAVAGTSTSSTSTFNLSSDYLSVVFMTIIGVYALIALLNLLNANSKPKVVEQAKVDDIADANSIVKISEADEESSNTLENLGFSASHALIVGVIIGSLLWIFDFISYLS